MPTRADQISDSEIFSIVVNWRARGRPNHAASGDMAHAALIVFGSQFEAYRGDRHPVRRRQRTG